MKTCNWCGEPIIGGLHWSVSATMPWGEPITVRVHPDGRTDVLRERKPGVAKAGSEAEKDAAPQSPEPHAKRIAAASFRASCKCSDDSIHWTEAFAAGWDAGRDLARENPS